MNIPISIQDTKKNCRESLAVPADNTNEINKSRATQRMSDATGNMLYSKQKTNDSFEIYDLEDRKQNSASPPP